MLTHSQYTYNYWNWYTLHAFQLIIVATPPTTVCVTAWAVTRVIVLKILVTWTKVFNVHWASQAKIFGKNCPALDNWSGF